MIKVKTYQFESLGTKISLSFYDNYSRQCINECVEECQRINEQYSRFIDVNTLSVINEFVNEWQEVDDEVFYLISFAKKIMDQTNSYFTLYTKEILEAFGYDKKYSFKKKNTTFEIPQTIEIRDNNEIKILAPIDFGGLGKGYAVDQMSKICDQYSKNYIINAGGDLFVRSKHNIHLEHYNLNINFQSIEIENLAIASSSSNRRLWGEENELHHLINPKNKKSANDIKATYVIANTCIKADSYATALFVMGFNRAKQLALELDLNVILVSNENEEFRNGIFSIHLNK